MDSKYTLLILAVIAGALYAMNAWIDISWWIQTGFDMASYNPAILPISWATWTIFIYTTWKHGLSTGTALYWFMAVVWLASNLYFSYGMISYWFGV